MPHPQAQRDSRYDGFSITLHWIIAVGIVLLAGLELFRHEFPKGSFLREGLKPVHQPAGVVLMLLIFARIAWRMVAQRAPAADGAASRIAGLVHVALYAMMAAVPLAGLLSVLGADKSISFGLFQLALPMKGAIGGIAKGLREAHETLAVTILALALLHAAAALVHHYILRDRVLASMAPWLSRDSGRTIAS